VDDDPGGVDGRNQARRGAPGEDGPHVDDQILNGDLGGGHPAFPQTSPGSLDGVPCTGDDKASRISRQRPGSIESLKQPLHRRELPEGGDVHGLRRGPAYFRRNPRPNPTTLTTAMTQTIRRRS
jgi:hypothetical protein